MGMLVEGHWVEDDVIGKSGDGQFTRAATQFRAFISADAKARFPAVPDRYHLYVSDACPWAHRTVIARMLKGLDGIIGLSTVEPIMAEKGWAFAPGGDPYLKADYLHQIYIKADGRYTGRASVPILWDCEQQTIVSNESADILRMFNQAFVDHSKAEIDLYPPALRDEIDAINGRIYETVNNGVYRCGFARSQEAYEEAFDALFASLDFLEQRLAKQPYLVGPKPTEADWRLFTTLIRFDAVYYLLFKCNKKRIADYPALAHYTCRLYRVPGVAATVNMPSIKTHYYASLRSINPFGIVPKGPDEDFFAASAL